MMSIGWKGNSLTAWKLRGADSPLNSFAPLPKLSITIFFSSDAILGTESAMSECWVSIQRSFNEVETILLLTSFKFYFFSDLFDLLKDICPSISCVTRCCPSNNVRAACVGLLHTGFSSHAVEAEEGLTVWKHAENAIFVEETVQDFVVTRGVVQNGPEVFI